jgi:PKD repeat protein
VKKKLIVILVSVFILSGFILYQFKPFAVVGPVTWYLRSDMILADNLEGSVTKSASVTVSSSYLDFAMDILREDASGFVTLLYHAKGQLRYYWGDTQVRLYEVQDYILYTEILQTDELIFKVIYKTATSDWVDWLSWKTQGLNSVSFGGQTWTFSWAIGSGTLQYSYTLYYGGSPDTTGQTHVSGIVLNTSPEPPVASFTYEPVKPTINLPVKFTSTSTDPDNDIKTYTWDFGDGNITTTTNPIIYHTYTDSTGDKTVTLVVKDGTNLSSTASAVITVYPIAVIEYSAPNGYYPNTGIQFDGSRSSAGTGGSITTWAWNWGDNSPIEYGALLSHSYTLPGTYTVTLTVTDSYGMTDDAQTVIKIGDPPVAAFTYTPTNPRIYDTINFDASPSTGMIIGYSWDFGDMSPQETGVFVTHSYTQVGSYRVTLTVTDGTLTDSTYQTIYVEDVPADISLYEPSVLKYPPNTQVTAKVKVTKGGLPAQNTPIYLDILTLAGVHPSGLYRLSNQTDTNGIAVFAFTSPSSGDYNAVFTVGNDTRTFPLTVIPALKIQFIDLQTVQVYDPSGQYDLLVEGKVVDKETNVDIPGFSVSLYEISGLPLDYVYLWTGVTTFEISGRVYDYYRDYTERILTVKIKVTHPDYYYDYRVINITMIPPTIYAKLEGLEPKITLGFHEFYIKFWEVTGTGDQLVSELNVNNIEVTIEHEDGTVDVYSQQQKDFNVYWQSALSRLAIAYDFNKVGDYVITVQTIGLQTDISKKFYVTTYQEMIPSWLTNPLLWLVVGVIIIIILFKGGGKKRKYEAW